MGYDRYAAEVWVVADRKLHYACMRLTMRSPFRAVSQQVSS